MKTILKAVTLLIASSSLALAGEWGTDWDAAKAQAKKENKPILINFTGTDWCGWCIRLEKGKRIFFR
ncbi:MAG: thioredoxin family protein [Verrucomicrobia bacterium]|nr:thioredoxin family protein [Verrucomicrobiota bacterium]MDA1006326.1 thioredoxin family protein [Verrucomicrobiota bacterium]